MFKFDRNRSSITARVRRYRSTVTENWTRREDFLSVVSEPTASGSGLSIGFYRKMGYYVPTWKMRNFRRYIMPRQFKRLSHSIYECKYHIVFCPKYRYRILRDEVAEYTRQQIYRLCQQKEDVEVLEMKVQPDHVHLVVSIPPKYAVSNFMSLL
jgi:hypothetical protein